MHINELLFWFLTALALFSAMMVVFSKNPVHSVLWLIMVFMAITGHYIIMNAQFLAIVNMIVYAGAIMVLFLFVITSVRGGEFACRTSWAKNRRTRVIGFKRMRWQSHPYLGPATRHLGLPPASDSISLAHKKAPDFSGALGGQHVVLSLPRSNLTSRGP